LVLRESFGLRLAAILAPALFLAGVETEDRWGEIAVYPELMAHYADRFRALIRRVWVDEPPGSRVIGTALPYRGRIPKVPRISNFRYSRYFRWRRY
jgi:hypothetical protein